MMRLAWLTLGCAVTMGCGPAVSFDTDTDDGSTSATAGTDSVGSATSIPPNPTSGPGPTTGPATTTVPTASDPTFGSEGSEGSEGSSGFGSSGGSTSFGSSGFMESSSGSSGGGSPDGANCTDNADCSSGQCYVAGALGGFCGECSSDADCEFGCNAPNPLASPPEGSTCSAGNLGENCETQAACEGDLECVEVINVPGIIDLSSCSECDTDTDCVLGSVCNIELDVADLSGLWTCTPPGTVPLGETCDFAGSGDAACGSGVCATADLMGLFSVGICSECDAGNPCGPAEVCVAPEVGLDGTAVPGTCV